MGGDMILENVADVSAEESSCEAECRRIVEELKTRILTGGLTAETKLQPEKKLAASFSSTVHVIRKALKQLREEGFLYSRPKFGVFVASRTTEAEPAADTSSLFQPVLDDCPELGIRFITQSRLPEQLKLFSSAIEGFRKQFPFCNIDIIQSENGKGITHDIAADTDIPHAEIRTDMIHRFPIFQERKGDVIEVRFVGSPSGHPVVVDVGGIQIDRSLDMRLCHRNTHRIDKDIPKIDFRFYHQIFSVMIRIDIKFHV